MIIVHIDFAYNYVPQGKVIKKNQKTYAAGKDCVENDVFYYFLP